MAERRSVTSFTHHSGPLWTVSQKVPELCAAYQEDYIRQLYSNHDFDVEIRHGGWSGRAITGLHDTRLGDQDIVLATKRQIAL
jgi:hypothetical protein